MESLLVLNPLIGLTEKEAIPTPTQTTFQHEKTVTGYTFLLKHKTIQEKINIRSTKL